MAKWLIPVSGVQADMLIGGIGELLDSDPKYFEPLQTFRVANRGSTST